MNVENPKKYSLQITTYEAIKKYSAENNISFRQASFVAFSNLKQNEANCGFNLHNKFQFYSSLKRFKNSKMNHPKKLLRQCQSSFTENKKTKNI